MLSYRHSFHAGNFADIIKHIVLVEILEHLTKKDSPFDYIDTHSGAGLFDLRSDHAQKTAEYHDGIGRLQAAEWPELARYFAVIQHYNTAPDLQYYPGSPLISAHFLRARDNAWLYELHPSDFKLLSENARHNRRMKVMCEDGLKGLLSRVPPVSRRALVLIDPSYEIKTDYVQVIETLQKAHKKFSTGTYALWYPVIDRERITQLEDKLIASGIKDIQRFELAVTADFAARGMTSSGMIVVNPPWGLFEKMSQILPKLARTLASGEGAFFKCDVLATE